MTLTFKLIRDMMVLNVCAPNLRSLGPTVQPAECKQADLDKQTLLKVLPLLLMWKVKIDIRHHPLLRALGGMGSMASILSHLY